eukprot:gene35-46_t
MSPVEASPSSFCIGVMRSGRALPGTSTPLAAGNGNGIKAGGYGGVYVANGVKHTVRFSVAFNNKAAGFYANHHPLALDFLNNTALGNGADYDMRGIAPDGAPASFGPAASLAKRPQALAKIQTEMKKPRAR